MTATTATQTTTRYAVFAGATSGITAGIYVQMTEAWPYEVACELWANAENDAQDARERGQDMHEVYEVRAV